MNFVHFQVSLHECRYSQFQYIYYFLVLVIMSIYMWEDVCKKEHKLGFFMSMGHLQKTRGFFSNSCPTLDDLGIPPFHSPTCLAYVVLPGAGRQGATTKTGVGMVVSWPKIWRSSSCFVLLVAWRIKYSIFIHIPYSTKD